MDAIVDKLTTQLNLTKDENKSIVFERPIGNNRQAQRLFLVGRLLSLKDFKVHFFMRTMKKLWSPRACVEIYQLEQGRFLFSFLSKSDRNCVLKGSPWNFENALLILGETDGFEDPHQVPLTTQPLWIRVKGVPLAYMERSTGQLIGDILGRFIETDSGRGGTCLGSFLRLKVVTDVTQPLKRCLRFTFPEVGSRLLLIKYEKLPNYCYLCGLCDHVLNQCSLRDSIVNHGDFKPFGSWLRAEVKEWLDEQKMEPPRSLQSRWVMKAPSSDELGLAGVVRSREEDEDEGDQLRQGTINEINCSINEINSSMTIEKGKSIIDNGGFFSPSLIGVQSCHNSNIVGLNPSSLQKASLQGKQVNGAIQTVNPNPSGRRRLSWKAKARATQLVSKAQKGDENLQQSELNTIQLEIDTETGLAGLPRQFQ
ncbi:hypothetical protein CerSpe_170190 [Prunus speciosa]